MKKILFIILSITCFITIASAKPVCEIITGTGFGIGDEIKCGSEHFYILDNNGQEIKAFAKYNLYVGKNYYIDHTEDINVEKMLQDERAIGAHGGEKGHPEYPEIAVTRFYVLNYNFTDLGTPYGDDSFVDAQIEPESPDGAIVLNSLINYKEVLEEIGLDVKGVDLITISELNELAQRINGKYLPLEEWASKIGTQSINYGGDTHVVVVGNLKEELGDKYSWLWSTTYWTRTIVDPELVGRAAYVFFVDTLGDVCEAYECAAVVGAGIRPVVTLKNVNFEYQIKTKTDGNGTIKTEKVNAYGGDTIKFTVTPNKDYTLGEIKVTDSDGRSITFKQNTFTMPNSNVLIEATFNKINPETQDIAVTCIAMISILTLLFVLMNYQKLQKN